MLTVRHEVFNLIQFNSYSPTCYVPNVEVISSQTIGRMVAIMAHTDHKESMKCKENLVQKEHGKYTWGDTKI